MKLLVVIYKNTKLLAMLVVMVIRKAPQLIVRVGTDLFTGKLVASGIL